MGSKSTTLLTGARNAKRSTHGNQQEEDGRQRDEDGKGEHQCAFVDPCASFWLNDYGFLSEVHALGGAREAGKLERGLARNTLV